VRSWSYENDRLRRYSRARECVSFLSSRGNCLGVSDSLGVSPQILRQDLSLSHLSIIMHVIDVSHRGMSCVHQATNPIRQFVPDPLRVRCNYRLD
jgi:hypothetical protein